MTYESVAHFSEIASLTLFIGFFIGVLLYAFWPGNRETFMHAAQLPLQRDEDTPDRGDRE